MTSLPSLLASALCSSKAQKRKCKHSESCSAKSPLWVEHLLSLCPASCVCLSVCLGLSVRLSVCLSGRQFSHTVRKILMSWKFNTSQQWIAKGERLSHWSRWGNSNFNCGRSPRRTQFNLQCVLKKLQICI